MALEQLKLVVDAVDNASGVLGGIGSALGRVGDIVGTAIVGAFAAGGAAVAAFGATSLKNAADFEQGMNMLQAVSGATAEQMAALSARAIQLGADMTLPNTSAKDAAEAMLELSKAGLSVDQTMAAAKGTLQLAAAAQIENARAAEITAQALNAFKLSGEEATRVADLLAATANASAAEITDVAAAMQMSATVAASAGVKIDELTTAIGLMANAGIKGSDAGTSLKTMLMRLQNPTDEAKGLMQQFGISVYDAAGQMRPMDALVAQFTGKLSGLTQEQRNAALATIFGTDAVRAANVVLMGGADAWDKMHTAVTKAGAAQELARAQTRGLNGAIDGLKSVLETAGLVLAGPFLKPLTEVVQKLGEFVGSLPIEEMAAFAAAALASGDPLGMLVGKLMELGGGLGGAQSAFGGLATFISSTFGPALSSLQTLFEVVFAGIQTGVTTRVNLITAFLTENGTVLQALFMSVWSGLATIVNTAIQTITAILQAFAPYMQAIFGQISLFIQAHGAQIVLFLQTAWNMIVQIITLALQLIQAIVVPILTAIALFIQQHGTEIQTILTVVWTAIQGIITIALTTIQAIIQVVLAIIQGDWSLAWTTIQVWAETVWNAISAFIAAVATAIQTFVATWLAQVQTTWNTIWTAVQTFLEGVMVYIRDTIIIPILTAIQTAWNTVLTFIKDNIVTPIFTAIQTFIQTLLTALFGNVLAMLSKHRADFLQIYSDIKLIIETLMTRARDFLVAIWTQIYNWFVAALTAIYNVFNTAWNAIKTLVFTVTNAIWQVLQSVWAQITAWITATLENIRTIFVETWERVRLAVVDALSAIWTAIKTTLERCVQGIIGFVGQFVEAGKAIVKGAEQGVWDAANALLNAVVDAMRRALEAAKRALGIGSPSREFARGVGEPIMQGVGVGIDDGAPAVEQTLAGRMKDLLGVALTGAGEIAAGVGDIFDGIDLPGLGFGGGGLSKELKALVDKVPSLVGLAKDLNLVGGDISMMDMGAGPWLDSIGVSWDQVKQIADWVKNGMPGDLGAGIGDLFGGVGDASAKMLEEIKTTLGEMRDLMKEMLAQMRDEWAYRFDDMLQIQMTRMAQMRDRFAGIGREMADIAAWTGGKINEGIGAGGWGAGGVIAAPAPRYAAMPAPIASQREGGATVNINATVNNAEDAELMARRVAVLLQTR